MTRLDTDPPPATQVAAAHNGFWRPRWRGEAPLRTLFWRDTLAVGTVINLLLGFAALMLAAQGGDLRAVLAVHLAPVPYNLFLALAVWRHPQARAWHRVVGAVWAGVMVVV
jgi:hypothetical protein